MLWAVAKASWFEGPTTKSSSLNRKESVGDADFLPPALLRFPVLEQTLRFFADCLAFASVCVADTCKSNLH